MPPYTNVASHQSNWKLPNFEILFSELPNHFLHFNLIIRQNSAQATSNLR